MENLQELKGLLNNIRNLSDHDEKRLRTMLTPCGFICAFDEYMELYNGLSEENLKSLINLVGYENLSLKFIKEINNKNCLVVQYKRNDPFMYMLFSDEQVLNQNIASPIFYQNIVDLDIVLILDKLTTTDQKKTFVKNCIQYRIDYLIYVLAHDTQSTKEKLAQYIPDQKIIELIEQQDSSNNVITLYRFLSDKNKVKVFRSEIFQRKVDINNSYTKELIILSSPDEIIVELIKPFYLLEFINYFARTKKTIFLKTILDETGPSDFDQCACSLFIDVLFSLNDENIQKLGEYRSKLFQLLTDLDDVTFAQNYFAKYKTPKSIFIGDLMYDKVHAYLETAKIHVTKISQNIINSDDPKILNLLVKTLGKSELLLLAVRNEFINDYVVKILNENQDYFLGTEIEDNQLYPMFNQTQKDIPSLLNRYMRIFPYLSAEQKKVYYLPFFTKNSIEIKKHYIESVKKDYNNLTSLVDLSFFNEQMINDIIANLDIKNLIKLILYGKIDRAKIQILRDGFSKRSFEVVDFIDDEDNRTFILQSFHEHFLLQLMNDDKKVGFINLINNKEFLARALNNVHGNLYDLIFERLVSIYNNEIEIAKFSFTPAFFDKRKKNKFYELLSFDALVNLTIYECRYEDRNSDEYKYRINIISKMIEDNIDIIFSINVITKLDELLLYLPCANSIKSYIDECYSHLSHNYTDLVSDSNSYSQKANCVNAVTKGYINEDNYHYVKELFLKNKYLLSSMDFRLLSKDFMKMGEYFIDKTSRHPLIASKILKIYDENLPKFNLIVALSSKIYSENEERTYNKKIEIIINYLFAHDIDYPENLEGDSLKNIESYILEQSLNKESAYRKLDIKNYIDNRNKEVLLQIEATQNIEALKNLIFIKKFWLNEKSVDDYLFSYVLFWEDAVKFCKSKLVNTYIEDIRLVKDAQTIEELKKLLDTLPEYTITDFFNVEDAMIDAYNKSISSSIKTKDEGKSSSITIDNRQIEVEELENNFGIYAHSTAAYRNMPLINNDYYESWNYNPNTNNHGICVSYIENSSYGTAPVKSQGVMFGFYNIQNSDIAISAPYDLYTTNDGYSITSRRRPLFCSLKHMASYTRHTHNEATLERRTTENARYSHIRQPDCIIIFEDMSFETKKNSIKAYEDFLAHGIKLKIKYLDRVKNAKREADKLNLLIDEYKKSFNLDILSCIIDRCESNLCGCDELGIGKKWSLNLFHQYELFQTEEIKKLITSTIKYIKSLDDINLRKRLANKLSTVIQEELYKYAIGPEPIRKSPTLIDDFLLSEINELLASVTEYECLEGKPDSKIHLK